MRSNLPDPGLQRRELFAAGAAIFALGGAAVAMTRQPAADPFDAIREADRRLRAANAEFLDARREYDVLHRAHPGPTQGGTWENHAIVHAFEVGRWDGAVGGRIDAADEVGDRIRAVAGSAGLVAAAVVDGRLMVDLRAFIAAWEDHTGDSPDSVQRIAVVDVPGLVAPKGGGR